MLWANLLAVLVVGTLANLVLAAVLLWKVSGLKLLCLTLHDMLAEVHEAEREILLGIDRIEAKLGIEEPEKKER